MQKKVFNSRFLQYCIYGCLAVIFFIGCFTRFYRLGQIPTGISDDEADKGYDAYALLKTGKDQWGERTPLISFKGFGDNRSPFYTYSILPFLPVFDLTGQTVRIPSALAGSLTILVVYGIGVLLFKKRSVGLLAAFFLSINPWHIGMSRMAMESTIGVFFFSLGFLLYLLKEKERIFLFLTALSFALTFYIYPGYVIGTPVFIFLLFLSDRKRMVGNKKELFQSFLVLGLFLLVVAPMVVHLGGSSAGVRVSQVNITNDSGVIDLVNEKRGICSSSFPSVLCRAVFNKYSAFMWVFFTNIFNHFSPTLLLKDGTATQYSILPLRGLLLSIEWLLFLVGAFVLLKKKTPYSPVLLLYLFVAAIPDSVTGGGHYGRFFISMPFWQLIAAYGVSEVAARAKKVSWVFVPVLLLGLVEFLFFEVEYLTFFPYRYSQYAHFGYKELMEKVQTEKSSYDEIYISSRINDTKQYIFYLFYTKYDPQVFQSGNGVEKTVEQNGWIRVGKIDTIHFIPSFPNSFDTADSGKKVLLIGAPSEFPGPDIRTQFEIKNMHGDVFAKGVTLADWLLYTDNAL